MAGKPKKRIDYAGWSVDIFSTDTKIDKLLDAHGWIGFGIYFYLCQMAFGSEGYFYEWCYDLCATTARKMGGGVGAGTVKETVGYCLQIGLFDKRLFDKWGILTSRGIQKSFLVVLKSKNRRGTEVIRDYWLLGSEKEDCQGVIFVQKNGEFLREDADSLEANADSLKVNGHLLEQKESKVKKSKEEKRIYYPRDADLDDAFAGYVEMRKKLKKPMTDRAITLAMNKLQELATVNGIMDTKLAIQILNQSVMRSWQGLFPLEQTKATPAKDQVKPKKNGFHNFIQREYDFAELEKQLIGR